MCMLPPHDQQILESRVCDEIWSMSWLAPIPGDNPSPAVVLRNWGKRAPSPNFSHWNGGGGALCFFTASKTCVQLASTFAEPIWDCTGTMMTINWHNSICEKGVVNLLQRQILAHLKARFQALGIQVLWNTMLLSQKTKWEGKIWLWVKIYILQSKLYT